MNKIFFSKLSLAIILLAATFSLHAQSYNQAPTMKDGAILHAWCWSFNTIKENMAAIADAGYTSIQTSPINKVIEGENGGMSINGNNTGKWYYHYQPVSYEIGNYQLGTEAEFKAMCDEADIYGIKIIVDAVMNHCTSTYSAISQEIKNIEGGAFHSYGDISNWNNRLNITQYKLLGLWDWNTQNPNVQQYLLNYLKKCVALGADGFRYDGAKHIELPAGQEDETFAGDFWPVIIDNGAEFQYLETLQPDATMRLDYYSQYGSVTVSSYGSTLRTAVKNKNLSIATISNYNTGGAPTDKLVTWVESHDNYCNDGTWNSLTDQQIKWAWAIIGARKDGTPLFYSRPKNGGPGNQWGNNIIGAAGSDLFKDAEIKAINKFRNVMTGEEENLSNPDENKALLMIARGNKGVVIINTSTSNIELNAATTMPAGNYAEVVTGAPFKVENESLTGTVKAGQIVVLTNGLLPSSINAVQKENISIQLYPNPATDYVHLRINDANLQNLNYNIYDIKGSLIEKQNITSENTIIDANQLSSGAYLIKILKNNIHVQTLKFVKE